MEMRSPSHQRPKALPLGAAARVTSPYRQAGSFFAGAISLYVMGGLPGLEAAQVSAPMNLLRGGLTPLLTVLSLARRTRSVVRQNLAWAFGYNLILVPLAAFNLLDRFGGPMLAGAAMGLSSLTVVLNALRLRR